VKAPLSCPNNSGLDWCPKEKKRNQPRESRYTQAIRSVKQMFLMFGYVRKAFVIVLQGAPRKEARFCACRHRRSPCSMTKSYRGGSNGFCPTCSHFRGTCSDITTVKWNPRLVLQGELSQRCESLGPGDDWRLDQTPGGTFWEQVLSAWLFGLRNQLKNAPLTTASVPLVLVLMTFTLT
jgi:hypothetical protein